MDDGYRVSVPRQNYRGANPKKRAANAEDARICALVEHELQRRYDEMPHDEFHVITYYDVARSIREDPETVRLIMMRIQGGSNGVTFRKASKTS